jgi:hypothetical protein
MGEFPMEARDAEFLKTLRRMNVTSEEKPQDRDSIPEEIIAEHKQRLKDIESQVEIFNSHRKTVCHSKQICSSRYFTYSYRISIGSFPRIFR